MTTRPETTPENPLPLVGVWLEEARTGTGRRNPTAMALATADGRGRPAVRMVLLKEWSLRDGYVVFHTNYESRKACELERNARAAGVLYWEELGRQLRIEGPVVRSPDEESDRYFRTRPSGSRLNAWASAQSRPLDDPAELRRRLERYRAEASRRPPFWGGYRLWIEALELWTEGDDRFHQRVAYERTLTRRDEASFAAAAWTHRRLQP